MAAESMKSCAESVAPGGSIAFQIKAARMPSSSKPNQIRIRAAKPEDATAMAKAACAAWPASAIANERNYALQIEAFPSGQLVAVVAGQVIGYATSLIM
jgi:TRAP-type C4-dicarboxylate transport system substrate-binding protein